jgi:uncharacterized protein YacL
MFIEIARLFVVVLGTAIGLALGHDSGNAALQGVLPMVGCLTGYVGGGMVGRFVDRGIGVVEARTREIPATRLIALCVGGVGGGVAASLLAIPVVVLTRSAAGVASGGLVMWIGVWAGVRIVTTHSAALFEMLGLSTRPLVRAEAFDARDGLLLDTSVVMDGQLVALSRTGLLTGDLLVPRFVLAELQGLADARDGQRAHRARRGLEALDHVRSEGLVRVLLVDDTVPEHAEVDAKLVALAERLALRLLTNDEPLARVAALHGIPVVNVRRLVSDLAPPIAAGELLEVALTRVGKEPDQGVGELDDGSLCIVNGGARLVGTGSVVVEVRSTVPTARGRLVFARPALGAGAHGRPDQPDRVTNA